VRQGHHMCPPPRWVLPYWKCQKANTTFVLGLSREATSSAATRQLPSKFHFRAKMSPPSTGPYPEPDQSCPRHPILSLHPHVLFFLAGSFHLDIHYSSPHSCHKPSPSNNPRHVHYNFTCGFCHYIPLRSKCSQTSSVPVPSFLLGTTFHSTLNHRQNYVCIF
jgi:hypothetical protein